MHVHRSVGQVTFVTCELVLGAPGEAQALKDLLDELEPETVALDLSVEDLELPDHGDLSDPYLRAHIAAIEEEAEEEILGPYDALLGWVDEHGADLKPLGSRSSVGLVKARRIKRTAKKTEAEGFEPRARAAVDALLDDAQVGPLTERRRSSLADSLTSVLRREPPRTLAVFTFPWGEMVSADVRRTLGLRRMEGERLAGGWPE